MSRCPTNNRACRQYGAIGIAGVVTLLLAVVFTALAVDAGRLWMQRRHLQTIADIASIQAAQQLGCNATTASVTASAQAAAAANGFAGSLSSAPNVVELGTVTTVAGIRQFAAGGTGAVHVHATQQVPASLVAGGLMGGNITLVADAVSRADAAIGAFSAGSFAARIDTEDSALLNAVLGDLLGSSLSLDLVSYQGLAATQLTLNDLLKASGQVGGLNSLLSTQMSLSDLVGITATAVSDSGTASATVNAAMQDIATATVNQANITLGDVLSIATPDADAAGKVGVNALSLVTTAAMIANGEHALSVPLNVNVPGIASITAQLDIISPPKMAVGPAGNSSGDICTSLTTAQVDAKVDVIVSIPLLAKIDLSLHAQVAQGTAGLGPITDNGDVTTATIMATPGVASISLTNTSGTGPASISLLSGILKVAELTLNLPLQPPSATAVVFNVAHPTADNLPQTQTVSSPVGDSLQNALGGAGVLDVQVLSILNLGLVNTVVSTVVAPLLGEVARVFLDPLLNMLGIRPGGMDVTLEGVQIRQSEPLVI